VIAQDRSVVVDARRQRQLKLSRLKALLHFDKLGLRAARRSAHASKISHVPLSDPQALTHLQEMLNQDRRAFNNFTPTSQHCSQREKALHSDLRGS